MQSQNPDALTLPLSRSVTAAGAEGGASWGKPAVNLDLLTLLENVVSGFVSFFYSLLRSLFETIRRPIRGPLRLYHRYKSPKSRQIGGVTFLCMGFFLSFYVAFRAKDLTFSGLAHELVTAIQKLPDTRMRELWPLIAASLASTIVIDAALRTLLDFAHLRRRRRDLVLASAEYALFWATPAAVVAGLVITITVELAGSIDPLVLLVVGAALILCIPAATILNLGLRKQKAGRRRARIGDVQWFVIIAGICVLMLVAATAGFDLWRAVSVNE